jgi:hypothetical protein
VIVVGNEAEPDVVRRAKCPVVIVPEAALVPRLIHMERRELRYAI